MDNVSQLDQQEQEDLEKKEQEMIKRLISPREWSHESKHYVQYISQNAANREDVANLHRLLDERLIARQARESGLCHIRSELHSQCFDEIIRQTTINSSETGLLLIKVRDELKMRKTAYEQLQNNSNKFGLEKQTSTALELSQMESQCQELEDRKLELEQSRVMFLEQKEVLEKNTMAQQQEDALNRTRQINQLQQQQEQLEIFLEALGKNNMINQQQQ